ncbi:MAG TPA: hypothetical protein VNL14_16770 [Candidatus Acidoferrales bacterium]|nr:hypothetical protein [Candidatus Acidoferrales bacterium]
MSRQVIYLERAELEAILNGQPFEVIRVDDVPVIIQLDPVQKDVPLESFEPRLPKIEASVHKRARKKRGRLRKAKASAKADARGVVKFACRKGCGKKFSYSGRLYHEKTAHRAAVSGANGNGTAGKTHLPEFKTKRPDWVDVGRVRTMKEMSDGEIAEIKLRHRLS